MKFGYDNRYEFDPQHDRLGESPHSEVFRAKDTQLERLVALKILRPNSEIDPSARQRFEREAKHTGALIHPNIAMVYDFATLQGEEFGHFNGSSYIAMEYLEGRTLDKVLRDRPLGYEEGVRVAQQMTDALEAVHKHELIHRDLKPANVILLPNGTTKLLDFGISRTKGETSITQEGILVGTVLYMSPEQVRGTELDERSDIFSMGSVLYHVLTQKLPFPGRSFPEVCMAILDGHYKRPSTVRSGFPQALEHFLVRCLHPAPEHRYPNAAAAHGGLLEVQNDLRLRGRARSPAALKGRMFLLPISTNNKAGVPLARGLIQDLTSALDRSTELELENSLNSIVRDPDWPAPLPGDLMLKAKLDLALPKAELHYTVKRYESGRWRTLWSDQISRTDDELALQGQLSGELARTLRRRLSDLKPTQVPRTSELSARAQALVESSHVTLHKGTSRHLMRAMSGFRQAIKLSSSLALAHAGLAEALVYKFLIFDGDSSFLTQAQTRAQRAIDIDPDCPEAHTSLGFAYQMAGRAADARREWRLAIQLDHNEWLAHRLLGAQYARLGNFAEAITLLQRSVDLNPTHLAAYDHLYSALERAGRYERALVIAERGTTKGEQHLASHPDDQDVRLHLALLFARRGSIEDARAVAKDAWSKHPKDGYSLFHLACVHALFGEADEALRRLIEAQSRGYYIQSELHSNSDLDLLRGNSEFQAL